MAVKNKKSELRKMVSETMVDIRKRRAENRPGKFFVRRGHYGMGYQVADDGMCKSWFHTPSEEQANAVMKLLADSKNPLQEILPAPADNWKPKVVVFKEKHGERHYIVHNLDELKTLALNIFMERKKEKFWYTFNDCEDPEKMKVSKKISSKLPKYLQEVIKERVQKFEEALRWYNEERKQEQMYKDIIERKDGALALRFLERRKQYECENFEIVTPQTI